MRRNHISGKMKRILAVACAAAVVLTSVPGGSFAYADEVTNEEAGLSETAEENAEAADAATTENAAETEEQVSTEESGTAETASVQEQEEAPAQEEEAPAKEEAPASDTAEPAKTENAEDNTQAPADQGKETVQESKPAEKANDASGETAPKTDTNKDNADEKKAPTVKKTTPAKKTEPKEAMKAGPDDDTTPPVVTSVTKTEEDEKIVITIVIDEDNPSEAGWAYSYKVKKAGKVETVENTEKENNEIKIVLENDGTYSDFTVSGKDAAGNDLIFAENVEKDLENLGSIVIDNNVPVVSKVDNEEKDGDVIVSITIVEANIAEAGWTYSYKKNGEKVEFTSMENAIEILLSGDGVYSDFTVSGKDAAGKDLTFADTVKDKLDKYRFVLDSEVPQISLTSVMADDDPMNNQVGLGAAFGKSNVTYTFTVTDNLSDYIENNVETRYIVSDSKININDLDAVDTSSWTIATENSFKVSTPTSSYVYVVAKDSKGNAAAEDFKALVIENNKPSVDIKKIGENTQKFNNKIEFNAEEGTDPDSGIQNVSYSLVDKDNKEVKSGNAANERPSDKAQIEKILNKKGGFSIDDASFNGKYTVKVKAMDWCGNESEEKTLEVFFDHTDPLTTITPDANTFGKDVNDAAVTNDGMIKINVTDTTQDGDPKHGIFGKVFVDGVEKTDLAFNESDVDQYEKEYKLADLGITTEGKHVLKVKAWDASGNNAEDKTFEFYVDRTNPTVKVALTDENKGEMIDGVLTFNKKAMEKLGDKGVEVVFTVTDTHLVRTGWKFSYTVDGVAQQPVDVELDENGKYTVSFKNDGKYSGFMLKGKDAALNDSTQEGDPSFLISAHAPEISLAMNVANKADEYHNDGDFAVTIKDIAKGSHISGYRIEVSADGQNNNLIVENTGDFGTETTVDVKHQDYVDKWGEKLETQLTVKISATTSTKNESAFFTVGNADQKAIKVETSQNEANEDETTGTFFYDTISPKLTKVSSSGSAFHDGGDGYYYISTRNNTDTYSIKDKYPGITEVSYSDKGETVTRTGTDTVNVEMSGEGVYKDFTVTGTDKAGNPIEISKKTEDDSSSVDYTSIPEVVNDINKEKSKVGSIVLQYGKVLDETAPVLTSITSSVASGKKFYDGKDRLWYVSSNTVTDTYTITDADPGTTALGTTTLSTTTVSYTYNGTKKTAEGTSKITVIMTGEGEYKNFKVTGTDKAGNKIITEQKLNDGKVNEVPKTESPIALTYGKVLDVTAPTVKFTTTKRSYADSLEGSRRYFRDTFTGTFTVADNFTLDNSKISSHIYRAEESEKYYNKLKAFKEESTIDPDKDQAKTIIYTGEVTADGSHSADGNYRFFIEGTDKAGNKIVVDKAQPASGEFALQESSSGKGTGFRSNDKVLDTVAPRAVMKVVNDKDKSFYTLDMSPSNYKLSDFDPYQKKIASKVKVTTDDKSPVDIAYDIVSTVKEGNKPGQYAGYGNDVSSTTSIPARRQIITINDLVIRDRAGNVLALSGDPNNENVPLMDKKTLYLSNKLIFDDKAPTTKPNDIVAPSATVKASGSITHRSADGRDLFNGARTLTVTITDEGGQVYSSGLKNVSYDVYVDGKKVAGDAKTYSEIGASKALNEKTASIKDDSLTYTKKFSIKLTTAYQSNDIEVRVNAEDHSGNKMQTVKYRCGIDSVGPKITVSYDNNSAQNEKYFKADRTATITVIDRNVDNGKIPIRTEVSVPGSFSWSSGGGNGANDRWVKRLGYNTDGDYTLQLGNCTDALGNKASITYEGTAPNAFTIDKTVPVISVTFDNNSFQNGKYYKDPRTATVTIQEHNFRGSDVQISQTGDAASAGGFNEGGDSHSATIYYGTDGDYSFNVNYTDLAGNPAQVVTVDEFTVDLTPPVVRFIEPDESKVNKSGLIAYTGDIAPEIFYSDKNITKGMAVITLNGAKANHSLDPVEDLFDGFEGTVRFGNLAKVRENDDIYTAIATVTDLAGNETPVTVIFSVNRFGSTFDYNKNEYTEGMIKTYYTNDAKDMILREINVNELESYTVTLYRDGENRKLVEGTDFKVEKKQVNGHYEYIYTIFASNFAEEGNYNVVVTSKDKAGNTNTNSSVRGDDGSNEVPLRFAVDKTAPTNLITGVDLTKNRFRESGLNLTIQPMDNMNAVASFHVRVTDSDGKVLFEQILTDKELAAFFQDQDGIYNLPIEQNTKWQTVEVVTTDAAGNVSTDYTVENNTAYNVLVTPNVFYQYINSKPMLGGTAALIALLIFLIAMKRKKDNDQAAA